MNKVLLLPIFCFVFFPGVSQILSKRQITGITKNPANVTSPGKKSQNVRIIFYNVENLYDPYNDTTKMDDEFTARGIKRWNYSKFTEKLFHLSRVILAAGEWDPPAIAGMCEIENLYVLRKLVYDTPLKSVKYKIIHYDSPDARGVDVALIYRPEKFRVLSSKNFRVRFPFDTLARTRDILYIKGIIFSSDTIHLFVNHWPSRRGGYKESSPRRNFVAGLLKSKTDSLFMKNPNSNIIIMGDFNDEPGNESLFGILKAKPDSIDPGPTDLINLMYAKMKDWTHGTIKYQGKWSIFDQFIVSGALLSPGNGIHTSVRDAHIFTGEFLLNDDARFLGDKLNRTYVGPRYNGGYSDHLPIFLDLWKVAE
jgi:hypothetical protein